MNEQCEQKKYRPNLVTTLLIGSQILLPNLPQRGQKLDVPRGFTRPSFIPTLLAL